MAPSGVERIVPGRSESFVTTLSPIQINARLPGNYHDTYIRHKRCHRGESPIVTYCAALKCQPWFQQ